MLNPNIVRWTYASAARHFRNIASKYGIQYYVEGDNRNTDNLSEFIEFRMDGPFTLVPAKDEQWHHFDINVLGSIVMGYKNLYRPQEINGYIYGGFTLYIPVYKIGDESQDDGSIIGCLKLRRELDQYIEVNQYGIVDKDTRIVQNSVEGHYRLAIELRFLSSGFESSATMVADLGVPLRGFTADIQSTAVVTASLDVT